MKKVIIALLVLASLFAFVSCKEAEDVVVAEPDGAIVCTYGYAYNIDAPNDPDGAWRYYAPNQFKFMKAYSQDGILPVDVRICANIDKNTYVTEEKKAAVVKIECAEGTTVESVSRYEFKDGAWTVEPSFKEVTTRDFFLFDKGNTDKTMYKCEFNLVNADGVKKSVSTVVVINNGLI